MQLGAKIAHQKHIAIVGVVFAVLWHQLVQHQLAAQAAACGYGGSQAGMVGLQAACRNQGIGALFDRFGNQIFQLAQLVACAAHGGHIVAFDKNAGFASQVLRQIAQLYQGGGTGEQRNLGQHET